MARLLGSALRVGAGLAAIAALVIASPARATSGTWLQAAWLVLVAFAALALVAVALRAPAPSEALVHAEPERGTSSRERDSVLLVTREGHAPGRGEAAAGEASPVRPPPAVPPAEAAPRQESALRRLSASMDDVSYEPGPPNVLSMTKRIRPVAPVEPPGVSWTRSDRGDETVLAFSGAIDTTTAARVRGALDGLAVEGRPAVTLDLSGVAVMDAAGVAVLAGGAARARAHGGDLRVVGLGRQPRAVLRLFRLDLALKAS